VPNKTFKPKLDFLYDFSVIIDTSVVRVERWGGCDSVCVCLCVRAITLEQNDF